MNPRPTVPAHASRAAVADGSASVAPLDRETMAATRASVKLSSLCSFCQGQLNPHGVDLTPSKSRKRLRRSQGLPAPLPRDFRLIDDAEPLRRPLQRQYRIRQGLAYRASQRTRHVRRLSERLPSSAMMRSRLASRRVAHASMTVTSPGSYSPCSLRVPVALT